MERIGHLAVAVDEVEHLVEQHQHGCAGRREHAAQGLGTRRGRRRVRAEQLDAPITGELTRHVDPRRLPTLARIPGVADEDGYTGFGGSRQPGIAQKAGDLIQAVCGFAGRDEVIQRGQRVRLAAAELGHQRHHRRRVRRLPRQSPQYHPCVLAQRAREAGAGEERFGIAVIGRCRAPDHLLQGDSELVRVERAAFADLLARLRDSVPRIKRHRRLSPHVVVSRSAEAIRPPATPGASPRHRIADTPHGSWRDRFPRPIWVREDACCIAGSGWRYACSERFEDYR